MKICKMFFIDWSSLNICGHLPPQVLNRIMSNYQVFFFFCLLLITAVRPYENILWLGASQTGKSSAVRLLAGGNGPISHQQTDPSRPSGQFVTYDQARHRLGGEYRHIYGASLNSQNSLQLAGQIERLLIDKYNGKTDGLIKAIIITQDYSSQKIQFPHVLKMLKLIMGRIPYESIIIALTKRNIVADKGLEFAFGKKEEVSNLAQKYAINRGHVVDFLTPSRQHKLEQSFIADCQFNELGNAISDCKPVEDSMVLTHREVMNKRVQQRQKERTTTRMEWKQVEEKQQIQKLVNKQLLQLLVYIACVFWILTQPLSPDVKIFCNIFLALLVFLAIMEFYHPSNRDVQCETKMVTRLIEVKNAPSTQECYAQLQKEFEQQIEQEMKLTCDSDL